MSVWMIIIAAIEQKRCAMWIRENAPSNALILMVVLRVIVIEEILMLILIGKLVSVKVRNEFHIR